MERWGDALVARIVSLPALDESQLAFAALLGGLFSSLAQRDVACVPLAESGAFILVDPGVAETVWSWAQSGDQIGSIVSRLAPGNAT